MYSLMLMQKVQLQLSESRFLKAGTYKHPQHIEKEVTFDDEYFDELIRAFDDKAIDNVAVIVGTHDEEQT